MYAELMLKTCAECKLEKPRSCFYKRKASKDGLNRLCIECEDKRHAEYRIGKKSQLSAQQKDWRAGNKDRIAKIKVKSKLGISIEDQDRLLEEQGYKCAICGIHQSTQRRRLALDHDHTTMAVRGYLCDTCNRSIGLLHDTISILESAVMYLKKHKK